MKRTRSKVSVPRFNLKDTNSKNETLIYLIYRYKINHDGVRNRFKYSTGKKVLSKYWSNDTGAKESLKHPEHKELNTFLRSLKNEVQRIVNKEPSISESDLKTRLDIYNGYRPSNESIIPTVSQFIEKQTLRSSNDERTKQKYLGLKNKLDKYCSDRGLTLTFDKVTLDFRNDFVDWLYNNGASSRNTVSKLINILIQFMNQAATETIVVDGDLRKLHYNQDYLSKDFKVQRTKTSKHYLTLNELEQLERYDLSNNESYKIVRDYFLVSCYTGLRISDLQRLSKEHFDLNKNIIVINTFKGRNTKEDNRVAIPILPKLHKIMLPYGYQLPKPLTEQKHNKFIKLICQQAGINRTVIHKASVKGQFVESSIPIYKKITNHTGRYTFINFMLHDNKVSPMELQKITGQSLKVLMGYERGNKEENAITVLKTIEQRNSSLKRVK